MSAIEHIFFIHFCYTEKFIKFFIQFSTKFNQRTFSGLVLGLWPSLPQTYMNIALEPLVLFEISWVATIGKQSWKRDLFVPIWKAKSNVSSVGPSSERNMTLLSVSAVHQSYSISNVFNFDKTLFTDNMRLRPKYGR